MGKKDLISGTLWDDYSGEVARRMNNPLHRGEITQQEADALGVKLIVADWGAEACGDAVKLYWAIDPATNTIVKAKFKSFGCGTAIASTDMMAELTMGKTVDEALKITNIEVENALRDTAETPAIPPQKMHCSVMAYDVIKKAASIYKKVDVEELEEEKIVCECARVTLSSLKDAIKVNNLKSVDEIIKYTKAGGFCKSCIQEGGHEKRDIYLVDLLEENSKGEIKNSVEHVKVSSEDFKEMSLIRKLKTIEKVLAEKIKPILAQDGGDMEVVDLKEKEDKVSVYIEYSGMCKNCPSSKTETLYLIEKELQEKVSKDIEVIPI